MCNYVDFELGGARLNICRGDTTLLVVVRRAYQWIYQLLTITEQSLCLSYHAKVVLDSVTVSSQPCRGNVTLYRECAIFLFSCLRVRRVVDRVSPRLTTAGAVGE